MRGKEGGRWRKRKLLWTSIVLYLPNLGIWLIIKISGLCVFYMGLLGLKNPATSKRPCLKWIR